MQLIIVLALLFPLALAQVPASGDPTSLPSLGWVVGLAALSPALTFAFAGWLQLLARRGTFEGALKQRLSRYRWGWAILWIGLSAAIELGLGWAEWVGQSVRPLGYLFLPELAMLAPVVVPLVVSWVPFYLCERIIARRGFNGRRDLKAELNSFLGYLGQHVRFYLLLPLVPAGLVIGLDGLLAMTAPSVAEAWGPWVIGAVSLAFLGIGSPWLMGLLWRMEPLPQGPLCQRLERLAAGAGVKLRGIYLWRTESTIVNAAVVGILPGMRRVLLTDSLVAHFSDEEIAAVFAHELGHIQRRHLLRRVAMLLLPVGAASLVHGLFPDCFPALGAWLSEHGIGPTIQLGVMLPLVMGAYLVAVLGRCARLEEFEADAVACQTLGESPSSAEEHLAFTLEKLAWVTGCDPHEASWLHPGIAARAARLRQMSAAS